MKKRILSLVLALTMVLGLTPIYVGAADTTDTSVNFTTTTSVSAANVVTLTVTGSGSTKITAAEFTLKYDTSVFELTSISKGSKLTVGTFQSNVDPQREGAQNVAWTHTTAVAASSFSFKATFTPKGTVINDDYTFTAKCNELKNGELDVAVSVEDATATITKGVAPVTISSITADKTSYIYGDTAATLTVTATNNADKNVAATYQWYSNTANKNSGGAAISGATSSTYTTSTQAANTTYYYCVATTTYNNKQYTATTAVQKITVNKATIGVDNSSPTVTVTNNKDLTADTLASAIGITTKGEQTPTVKITGVGSSTYLTLSSDNTKVTAKKVGNTTATVKITASNHADKTVTVNVTITDKNDVSDKMSMTAKVTSFDFSTAGKPVSDLVDEANVSGITTDGTSSVTYTVTKGSKTVASGDYNAMKAKYISDAGTYTITADYEDDSQRGSVSATVTVNQATLNVSGWSWDYTSPFTFDGQTKTVSVNVPDSYADLVEVSYTNEKGQGAGTYTAKATVTSTDANYTVSYGDGKNCLTKEWTIQPAESGAVDAATVMNMRVGSTASVTYATVDSLKSMVTSGLTLAKDGLTLASTPITLSSNASSKGFTAAISGSNLVGALSAESNAAENDTFTFTVNFTSNNYNAITLTVNVKVIDKTDVSNYITFTGGSANYTGKVQSYEKAKFTNSKLKGKLTYSYAVKGDSGYLDETTGKPLGAGTYLVTAKYEDEDNLGTKTVEFTIKQLKLTFSSATISKQYDGTVNVDSGNISKVTFSGNMKTDTLDYTLDAEFQSAAVGKQKVDVTITLQGTTANNYYLAANKKTITGTITQKDISGAVTIGDIKDQNYTGKAITPEVTVTSNSLIGSDQLVLNKDYTVKYSSNTKAGTATVTVTTKSGSNYTFKPAVTKTFTIEVTEVNATMPDITVAYIGAGQPVTVLTKNTAATATTESGVNVKGTWSWSYKEGSKLGPTDVGTYDNVKVTFTPSDKNFATVTTTTDVTITPATLTVGSVSLKSKEYDGTADASAAFKSVTLKGTKGKDKLVLGTDYQVVNASFADANVGTKKTVNYSIQLMGTAANNYQLQGADSLSVSTGTITTRTITVAAQVSDPASLVYTGEAITPDVSVTLTGDSELAVGDSLTKDRDYTLKFSNNIKAGTASVTVSPVKASKTTAASNYTFKAVTAKFTIEKKSMSFMAQTITMQYTGAVPTVSQIKVSEDATEAVKGTWKWVNTKTLPKDVTDGVDVQAIFTPSDKNINSATVTVHIVITPAVLTPTVTVTAPSSKATSNDAAFTVTFKNSANKTVTLKKGTDYTISGAFQSIGDKGTTATADYTITLINENYTLSTSTGTVDAKVK